MTMQAMMDYLVSKGFSTTKRYRKDDATYVFNISKNGKTLVGEFPYPENVDDQKKNWLQEEFLDQFLDHWNRECEELKTVDEYCKRDVEMTEKMWTMHNPFIKQNYGIKNVIFNEPATIVFWTDGTKTVVKCENEEYDPEKGLAMAISKKALGNQGNYYNTFTKWLTKYGEECKASQDAYAEFIAHLVDLGFIDSEESKDD